MRVVMDESQFWHYERLITKYQENKKNHSHPIYASLQQYFAENNHIDLSDEEYAEIVKVFIRYCKKYPQHMSVQWKIGENHHE